MESTQDIIRGYLSGNLHDRSIPHPDTEDEYDLDLITDPLDDTTGPPGGRGLMYSSPPTPNESPLKAHFGKLRGSPTKAKTPLKPNTLLNEDMISPHYDDYGIADTHKIVKTVPQGISSSKEFEKYSRLLTSSTDRLMKQLAAEKDRTQELERKLRDLESEKFRGQVMKSDYDVMNKQYLSLQEKHDTILTRSRQLEEDNNRLTRDNKLLREKLIKYKNLYEDLRDRQISQPTDSIRPGRSHSAPGISSGGNSKEHEAVGKQIPFSELPNSPLRNVNATDNSGALPERKQQFENVDFERVHNLLEQFVHFVSKRPSSSESESDTRSDNASAYRIKDRMLPTSVSPVSSAHHTTEFHDASGAALADLMQSVQQIGADLKSITALVQSEDQNKINSGDSNRSDKSEVAAKHGNALHDNSQPHTKTVERESVSNIGRCDTHNRRQCEPCIAAEELLRRPNSQSTAKEFLENNTEKLMGRYIWNRTI